MTVRALVRVYLCVVNAVKEDELKRRTGEFDLEAIAFLDLSDQGFYRPSSLIIR